MTKHFCLSLFAICLFAFGPSGQEVRPLEPGQMLERELAGGQSHTYQIALQPGQFVRIIVEQKGANVVAALTAPDGKQLMESNLTTRFGQESLSYEATGGEYRLALRAANPAAPAAAYSLRLEVRAAATAADRQRIAAERILIEAGSLATQGGAASQQAIEKYQEALRLWREIGDRYWEAYTLFSVGRAYDRLSRSDQAIEYLEQALQISREAKDKSSEADTLIVLGNSYYALGRYEKAIEYFEQTLVIRRQVKDREGEGAILSNLGAAYNSSSRNDKAIEHYEQALSIMREVKNRRGEGFALTGLGNIQAALSRYEKAIEYHEQGLAIYREIKDRITEGTTLMHLGRVYRLQGRYEKSISSLDQALSITREVKNRRSEGEVLDNLGQAYFNLSRYDEAIEYLKQALEISREVKARLREANALITLANVYVLMGQYDKAVERYDQALAISRELKNRLGEANVLMNLGIVYNYLDRQDKAIEYLEQALPIIRESKDRFAERNALNNLGNAHNSAGRYNRAIEYYEQALAITREIKTVAGEAALLGNLGNTYFLLGRYDKSIEYSEQALEVSRETKDRAVEGRTLSALGRAYRSLGRYEKASQSFEQALAILREVKDHRSQAGAIYGFAKVERDRGNLTQARALVEESLKMAESLRSEIHNQESRVTYFAAVQDYNDFYIDLLMRLHKASPSQGFDVLAVEASERARARGLLELLTEAGTQIREGVDASLLERERALAVQLNAKATRRMQLLSAAHKPEQIAELAAEISQLENDFEQAQRAIRRANPRYAALTQPQPLSLTEIQQQLDQETLLLEYWLGEESSYLWAVTRDSLTSFELPKQQQIKDAATNLYKLLTARSHVEKGEGPQQKQQRVRQAEAQLPEAARELSLMLLAPVATRLAGRRLIVVADGALQYIPFAMLPSPNSRSAEPLAVAHEIISLPSISTIAVQRKELADRKPAPKMVAVIADPVFSSTDERLKAKAPEQKSEPLVQGQGAGLENTRIIEHLAEGSATGDSSRLRIPRLPFTRREAAQIISVAQGKSNLEAIDFKANRATVISGELKEYRYLHFATHGLLDSERPKLSALALSMVDAQGTPQDGFLRANEVYNLSLPAELVVLSACQTGLGQEVKGEGLVGLTRGFMYAGAARVVVSLWSVSDRATAELMTRFYEKMLKQGARPAAALRAAQVEMWKQKPWQSPYYWAAFTLQGEWR